MATQCPYCTGDTAGIHDFNCPLKYTLMENPIILSRVKSDCDKRIQELLEILNSMKGV